MMGRETVEFKTIVCLPGQSAVVQLQGTAPQRPTSGTEYEFVGMMVGVDWSSVIFY